VGDALEESAHRHARKTSGPSAERNKSVPPGRATPGLSASPRDLRRSRSGRKTPNPARPEPEARGAGIDATSSWALKARTLSSALEEALRSGHASAKTRACVERAYAAWSLDGVTPPTVARVAHLVRRAHEAIRGTSRSGLEAAYTDCARLLHMGLPSALRRRVSLETAVDLVRNLRREADSWVAVVEVTMHLVGWTDAARSRAAEAIRQALEEYPPESARDEG
jgi:hypothetical protein